jgi:hypothetical protein
MKKGTFKAPINTACRVIQLIPIVEKEKLKGTTTPANSALKTLTGWCKKFTKQSNIFNLGPDVAKQIEILRSAGLGKYFYQSDADKAKKNINKAAVNALQAQKAAEDLPVPEPAVTNAVNKVVNAVTNVKRNNTNMAVNITKKTIIYLL